MHIHSFGDPGVGSYDVTDTGMTPEAIVDLAIKENLQVIAITDHNAIGNVRRAVKHAEGKPILVVPGVELSTPQGHLLIYCPTPEALEACFGKLTVSPDRKFCQNNFPQCLKEAEDQGGFGIAAHIELDTGLEKAHPKFDLFKQGVFDCKNLLGLEVNRVENSHFFTHGDEDQNRRNCVVLRCKHLNHEEKTELAKVMNSDAHSVGALGRNAQGAKKLTRYKMESLTFDSLRIALSDCAARVRLEDLVPPSIPHFVGMKLEGGFLKGQTLKFSKNLTCIIGGRGAGKSTMLESLRVCSGNKVDNSIVDSEVWPDSITLLYQDEVGTIHELTRSKMNNVVNRLDPINGFDRVNIESYGQGKTAETIQHCDEDPSILLRFLDDFIGNESIPERDEEIRDALLKNQTEIEQLSIQINRIPDIEKAKNTADGQVATLKQQKAGELVELEQKLISEKKLRDKISGDLGEFLKTVQQGVTSQSIADLQKEIESTVLAVGKTEGEQVRILLGELSAKIDSLAGTLKQEITDHRIKVLEKLKAWVTKEKETRDKIEEIRRDLEKQNIKLDIAFIRKVTKDASDYATQLADLKKKIPLKKEAENRRRELLTERRKIKARMATIRQSYATLMNKNLASAVFDYTVTVRFHEGVLSRDLESLIKEAMEWRTSQVPKAFLISRKMSPFTLLDAIGKNDPSRLEAICDRDGNRVFTNAEATKVLATLRHFKNQCDLERCEFQDLPEVFIARPYQSDDGKDTPLTKDFSRLSLGQQQSILLSIMLFSKSTAPLIIDQPEDNLDSEFIYKTLVRSLRSVKEQRQVIIVTHNANIAVLGDAELIIPLRGQRESSVIRDRGSIDTPTTKELVCTILEGSRQAFKRRQDVYGF